MGSFDRDSWLTQIVVLGLEEPGQKGVLFHQQSDFFFLRFARSSSSLGLSF